MAKYRVIIVGGGVIGLSTAYQLSRRGVGPVLVLEKGIVGDGSSRRAAGITTGLLWSETGIRARKIGLQLFRELGKTLPGYTFHGEQGCLNLFSPELWAGRQPLLPLYDRLGAPYRVLSSAEVARRWPVLHPPADFVGLHDPQGGYSEPPEYLAALAKGAASLGVEIREHRAVEDWLVEGGRLKGVRAGGEALWAETTVAAVHAWTLPVLAPLGIRPPVKHFVHQRYLSAPLPAPLTFPPVNADPFGGYIRPAFGGRILLGVETPDREEFRVAARDFDMRMLTAPAGLREQAALRFQSLFPTVSEVGWETAEVGLISFSMDGEPVLGPVASMPGLFLAQAFHSGGFSYNTVAGLLLAEWIAEGAPSIDVGAFSPDRFARAEAESYLALTNAQKDAFRRRH